MALYFFDLNDTGESFPDEAGAEFHGIDAAKDEAVRALVDMTAEVPPGGVYRELTITVRDGGGLNLLQVAITFEVRVLY